MPVSTSTVRRTGASSGGRQLNTSYTLPTVLSTSSMVSPTCEQVGEHVRSHGAWLPKRVTADSASTLETRMAAAAAAAATATARRLHRRCRSDWGCEAAVVVGAVASQPAGIFAPRKRREANPRIRREGRRGGRPWYRSRGYRVSAPLTRVCAGPSRLGRAALVCVTCRLVAVMYR